MQIGSDTVETGTGWLRSLEGTAKKHRFDVIGNREVLYTLTEGSIGETMVLAQGKPWDA